MAPQNRNAAIRAFNRRLRDQDLDNEHSKGSNKEPTIWIDPEVQRPQTRAQTVWSTMEVESSSQCNEKGNVDWSKSDEVPQREGVAQSSIDPSISVDGSQHH